MKRYELQNVRSVDVKIFLPVAPDRRLIWYTVRDPTFWLIAVCPRPIWVVCGLPPGYYNLTSGCHGICSPPNFLADLQMIKNSIYIVNVYSSKILAFKGGDQKIVKYGSGSYWRPKASPPMCLFDTLFSCQCLFKGTLSGFFRPRIL
jgi:hypothetical protein